MLQTEYVRNLHCNYQRLLLDQTPEEKRYQYCILNRGGIKGLLPCSLRYINGQAYLYYDISSRQSIVQLFGSKSITREWIRDFMWSFQQIQQELDRFLLDGRNVVWYPEQVFQDLDNNIFSFMYIPYYERETGFLELVDFWVEHIDYGDEALVEFVYHVHDRLEKVGDVYLQDQIFKDAAELERKEPAAQKEIPVQEDFLTQDQSEAWERVHTVQEDMAPDEISKRHLLSKEEKKGIFHLFDGKKKRNREIREAYQKEMSDAMNGYAVAEDTSYNVMGENRDDSCQEEYGRTIYIEEHPDPATMIHYIYSPQGKLLASLESASLSIGKKKGEVDLVLEDLSVSRMHARIVKEGAEIYLEDLNSTNGTFKNGLRLEPYERRKLETEDEIRCGNVTLIFK